VFVVEVFDVMMQQEMTKIAA